MRSGTVNWPTVPPGRYDMGTFKNHVYLHLVGRNAPGPHPPPLVLHGVVGGGNYLPGDPNARLP